MIYLYNIYIYIIYISIYIYIYIYVYIYYEATIVNNADDQKQVYFGASDTTFKERYRNHTRDFNHEY